MTDVPLTPGTNPQDNAQLNSQITELNKKIDALNDKLDKNQAATEQLMKQSKMVVDTTGSVKA